MPHMPLDAIVDSLRRKASMNTVDLIPTSESPFTRVSASREEVFVTFEAMKLTETVSKVSRIARREPVEGSARVLSLLVQQPGTEARRQHGTAAADLHDCAVRQGLS